MEEEKKSFRDILKDAIMKLETETYKNPNYSEDIIGEKKHGEDETNPRNTYGS